MNHRMICLGFLSAAICIAGPARAEITIHQSRYAAGVLVVKGETSRPHQRVTLDGRFTKRTDRNKNFTFRIRYLPHDCMARIKAGAEVRPVVIANCTAVDSNSKRPAGTIGSSGTHRSKP